jgi:hypothetical protein
MEEFKDFKLFMTSVEEYGKVAGIIKVVPPKEWFVLTTFYCYKFVTYMYMFFTCRKEQLPELLNLDQIKVTKPIVNIILLVVKFYYYNNYLT